jgi:hypothetical protein
MMSILPQGTERETRYDPATTKISGPVLQKFADQKRFLSSALISFSAHLVLSSHALNNLSESFHARYPTYF